MYVRYVVYGLTHAFATCHHLMIEWINLISRLSTPHYMQHIHH